MVKKYPIICLILFFLLKQMCFCFSFARINALFPSHHQKYMVIKKELNAALKYKDEKTFTHLHELIKKSFEKFITTLYYLKPSRKEELLQTFETLELYPGFKEILSNEITDFMLAYSSNLTATNKKIQVASTVAELRKKLIGQSNSFSYYQQQNALRTILKFSTCLTQEILPKLVLNPWHRFVDRIGKKNLIGIVATTLTLGLLIKKSPEIIKAGKERLEKPLKEWLSGENPKKAQERMENGIKNLLDKGYDQSVIAQTVKGYIKFCQETENILVKKLHDLEEKLKKDPANQSLLKEKDEIRKELEGHQLSTLERISSTIEKERAKVTPDSWWDILSFVFRVSHEIPDLSESGKKIITLIQTISHALFQAYEEHIVEQLQENMEQSILKDVIDKQHALLLKNKETVSSYIAKLTPGLMRKLAFGILPINPLKENLKKLELENKFFAYIKAASDKPEASLKHKVVQYIEIKEHLFTLRRLLDKALVKLEGLEYDKAAIKKEPDFAHDHSRQKELFDYLDQAKKDINNNYILPSEKMLETLENLKNKITQKDLPSEITELLIKPLKQKQTEIKQLIAKKEALNS